MEALQESTVELREDAEGHRSRRDFKRALPLYEALLRSEPSDSLAWLGAAECALELGFRERAMHLLAELKPFYSPDDSERWVNLRSEALRRFGPGAEGIAFVEQWEGRVGPETRAKLLLRKASLLVGQGRREAAAAAVREAWATCSSLDPSPLVSFSNVALMSGELTVAAEVGKKLLRTRNAIGGLYLHLFATFFRSHPLLVRLPIALALVAILLIPALRPAVLVTLAFLALGVLVSSYLRMIVLSSSLTLIALVVAATYTIFLLAEVGTLGAVVGTLLFVAIVIGTVFVLLKGRRRSQT
ncbi:MAG: tetratricopeptide repeat protein [Chloroflexota bacterium]